MALLPGEDRKELAALHAAATADWRPRDAYERRWVHGLVAAMWRQDRLHSLEIAALTPLPPRARPPRRRCGSSSPSRYGARIDKDIGRALQALRVLRDRPDACLGEPQDGTSEPAVTEPQRNRTNEMPPRTSEPGPATPEPTMDRAQQAACTPEPGPRLNRHQRRALAALQRRRAA